MDIEKLKSVLNYDPETGEFWWKERDMEFFKFERDMKAFNTKFAGKICGTVDGKGYLHINFQKKFYLLHRLAWAFVHGNVPKVIDHINRVKTDNRIVNLRDTTTQGNMLNRRPNRTGKKTSKYKGVSKHTHGKWQAQTKVDGKQIHLGLFDTEEAAYKKYLDFMADKYGEGFFK